VGFIMSESQNLIRVAQIGLSVEAANQFANLAMAVELKERQRFAVSKTVDMLVRLINVAAFSTSKEVKHALMNLDAALDMKNKALLRALGAVDYLEEVRMTPSRMDAIDKKYLFGARG
jgi:hypothetical protein